VTCLRSTSPNMPLRGLLRTLCRPAEPATAGHGTSLWEPSSSAIAGSRTCLTCTAHHTPCLCRGTSSRGRGSNSAQPVSLQGLDRLQVSYCTLATAEPWPAGLSPRWEGPMHQRDVRTLLLLKDDDQKNKATPSWLY